MPGRGKMGWNYKKPISTILIKAYCKRKDESSSIACFPGHFKLQLQDGGISLCFIQIHKTSQIQCGFCVTAAKSQRLREDKLRAYGPDSPLDFIQINTGLRCQWGKHRPA